MTETLQNIFAAAGIKPKRWKAGASSRCLCPQCNGGSTKERSLSLKIDQDGLGATANCHRGSCAWTFGKRVHDREWRPPAAPAPARKDYRPAPMRKPEAVTYPPELFAFFAERGISEETVIAFGVYVTPGHKFPGDLGWHDAIVFPYLLDGKAVNHKYRAVSSKEITAQDYQAYPTLFNADAIVTPDVVWWVEGEPDTMAMHEAGYSQTVSLKDGASKTLKDVDDPSRADDKRFSALSNHSELIGRVQKFVLAGDMDQPGLALKEELARRLGRHRCWTVKWPEGCKDACDALRKGGTAMVQACVEAAKPFPIEGVQEVTGDQLDEYLEKPAPATMAIGIRDVDRIMKFPGEGRLIVITGVPNAGKTQIFQNFMVNLMRDHGRRFLVFSPEMQPFEEFSVQCAQILIGKPARATRDTGGLLVMSRAERREAGDWLKRHMLFLSSDSTETTPTLDWILDRARDCVLRFGITDLSIDPFNEIEAARGAATETEFIGRCLQRAKAFGLRHGCNVWITAHPAKMRPAKLGEKLPPPGPYDISGSANWANKPDIGITVHTPDDITEIHVWKSRFGRWGRKGGKALLTYDRETGRY